MKVLFAWFLSMVLVCGAETVAWQVPLEGVVEGGLKSPKLVRLEGPPAESVFIEEGDELWDLMGALEIVSWDRVDTSDADPFGREVEKRSKFEGDWLIWNARSKRVVGRGSWDELEEIDGRLVYEQVRSTLVIEKNGRVEGSVMTVCGSGERAEVREGKLMAKVAPNLFWYQRLTDLSYEVKFDRGDGRITEVKSDASIPLGKGVSLAEWQEKGDHYELSGTFEPVSEDGVLMKLVRLREVGGKAVRLEEMGIDYGTYDGTTLKNGLKVGVFSVPPDLTSRRVQERPYSEIDFPPELEGLSGLAYEDVTEMIKDNGVNFDANGAMVLMDHSRSIVVAINDSVNMAKIEEIVESVQDQGVSLVRCKVEWGGHSGELLMRSGDMGAIRQIHGGVIQADFKVAPNISRDDREVELSFSLKVPSKGVSLSSSATMIDGVSLLVGELERGGEELDVTIECEVIPEEQW